MTMTTASEAAAARLLGNATGNDHPMNTRPATGERARLAELIDRDDDLNDDESAEFDELASKWRAGKLAGSPERVVRQRRSVAGEREDESAASGRHRTDAPKTASEQAAASVKGYI